MLSYEQKEEKLKKVKLVVDTFLASDGTIEEVASKTGITSSSVQRYLNDVAFIKEAYPHEFIDKIILIRAKLIKNKKDGLKKGGETYAINNESIKDEQGRFQGSRRR